jgi:hypothetical protein
VTWEVCSEPIAAYFRWSGNKIQISRDNKTWANLSGEFADNLRIKGYVATKSDLPINAMQGDIYGVGPTYAEDDTAHTNPIYRYYVRNANTWVDNGSFTSFTAGIVQEIGDSENAVMSQKAVSAKLAELGSEVVELSNRFYKLKDKYTYPTESYYINQYITNSGIVSKANGWVYTKKIKIEHPIIIEFKNNIGYYLRLINLFGEDGMFIGQSTLENEQHHEISSEFISEMFPAAKYFSFDIHDGKSTDELTNETISGFELCVRYKGNIQELGKKTEMLSLKLKEVSMLTIGDKKDLSFYRLNQLITNSGDILNVDGWIYTDKIDISDGLTPLILIA